MDLDRVQTERLLGCRPLARDADELHAVLADPRVAGWLWPGELGGPRTLAQVRALLVRDMDHWKRHGFGPWVLREAQSGRVAGRAGAARIVLSDTEEVQLMWLIAADLWGRGLATEIARAAVAAAFGALALESVVALTLPHNAASRRVMEHLDMALERELEHAGLPHVLYRLRR